VAEPAAGLGQPGRVGILVAAVPAEHADLHASLPVVYV
jgi:hypothetical protein